LDCGSPLPLFNRETCDAKAAAAVQNLAGFSFLAFQPGLLFHSFPQFELDLPPFSEIWWRRHGSKSVDKSSIKKNKMSHPFSDWNSLASG
jgi:hypothetical protein